MHHNFLDLVYFTSNIGLQKPENDHWWFLKLMAFMDIIQIQTNIVMLGVLEVNSFIISKVMAKKLKMDNFWLFKAYIQCKIN